MSSKNLKLNGTSEDDIRVISAHLQDSITQVKNIAHLKKKCKELLLNGPGKKKTVLSGGSTND